MVYSVNNSSNGSKHGHSKPGRSSRWVHHTLGTFQRPKHSHARHYDGPDSQPEAPALAEVQEDLDDDSQMWKMFLDEVKEEDSRYTDAWKEDANSIVVFTGLFSAIVGAFVIEFYKTLSPNSNMANQSSSPGTAMVWANALWLISLVLSLTCALIATLLQQWARRYIETPKFPNILRHRARVRSLLLTGTKSYKIPIIVEMLPTLLHLSVGLFLAGLVIAFHTINKTVSIAVDIAVGVSGLAYLALSILPCLDMRCPYRTPISQILWYPCRAFLSFTAPLLLGLRKFLNQPAESSALTFSNHWRYFRYGLEKSIIYHAVETLMDGDRGRVIGMFNQLALGDRHTFLKFAASIPIHKIPDFFLPIKSASFRESLLVLLRSVVGTRPGLASGLDSDLHRRSLLVCIHAICYTVKAKAPTTPDLDFMRYHFADIGLMRALWNDDDNSISIASRSVCALVAKQVVRKDQLEEEDLEWLKEVTGSSSDEILKVDVTVRDQMIFKSFVKRVFLHPVISVPRRFSTKDVGSFNETLAILLGVRTRDRHYFYTPHWQTRLSDEVGKIQRYDPLEAPQLFFLLRTVFPSLPAVTPADAVVPPSDMRPHPTFVLPPSRDVSPPRLVLPLHVPPSPYSGPPLAQPSPYSVPPRAQPSPYSVPPRAQSSPRLVRSRARVSPHTARGHTPPLPGPPPPPPLAGYPPY